MLRCSQPLHRGDGGALGLQGQEHAGVHGSAVQQDRASAALAPIAARLGPGQVHHLTEQVQKRPARLNLEGVRPVVDRYAEGVLW